MIYNINNPTYVTIQHGKIITFAIVWNMLCIKFTRYINDFVQNITWLGDILNLKKQLSELKYPNI